MIFNTKLSVVTFLYLLNTLHSTVANDVFGCGGFIKTPNSEIDFSKVEIKLLTKQGSVKDTTDCSPSNGYYFIPIYDKGEYILKVSGGSGGWSFEPEAIEINFDGKTDICSMGKDVNFVFKGFGITGKVGIVGHSGGAKGVNVELKTADGKFIGRTRSAANGVFSFTPIVPGKYVIHMSHDKWHFVQQTYPVTVNTGNTEIPAGALMISGYDVHVKGQIEGLDLVLFDKNGQKSTTKCQNNVALTQTEHGAYNAQPLCSAQVSNGAYIFTAIPPGQYLVLPHFRNRNVKVNLNPQSLEIEVQKDSLFVEDSFEITGLSVSGRVLYTTEKGVSNALVTLNGNQQVRTQSDGSYSFENIKTGTYIVKVAADNLQFNEHTVKISMSNPVLPNILPSAFRVCGQVVSEKSYKVVFQKHGSTVLVEQHSEAGSGEFCVYLGNGKYAVNVETSNSDKANGIQFFPLTQTIEVTDAPQSGIVFSQLRATVNGEVKCLSDAEVTCHNVNVNFFTLDANNNRVGQPMVAATKGGKFSFADVLPGSYELSVPQTVLCWENHVQRLTVKEAVHSVPAFKHSGYQVSIVSSHADTHFKYTLRSAAEQKVSKSLDLKIGVNQFCVAHAGVYDFTLSGCHQFDENQPKSFSTRDQNPVTVSAIKHRNGVRILSEKSKVYKLIVETGDGKQVVDMKAEANKVDGYFAYRHEFYLRPEESIKLTPINDEMLFKPDTISLSGSTSCVDNSQNFIATQGLVIIGKTTPKISDAKIKLTYSPGSDEVTLTAKTDANGAFKFGPIDSSLEYTVTAEKESYVFSEFDKTTNTFTGYKLCEIIVSVKDEQGNKLSGVLLSLSGGESYRKNLVTGDDASINFHSLSPSQYYLRPMMKEYKFEPNSKMIEVGEGETVNVELIGKRVAFSVFGAITSLNGDPFPNILVEAVADDSCNNHQEEGSSEFNGLYRIRGLQPKCQYSVRVKSDGLNANVDRTIPTDRRVTIAHEDVRNINIIAISPLGFVDVTARIMASSNDYYKTLKVQMYKKGQSDSPLHTQRVDPPLNPKSKLNPGSMVFFPRIPYDGKTYYVTLTTTLSEKSYKINLPHYEFVANASSRFIEIDFKPEVRVAENENTNSVAGLILIALVAFAFFRQDLTVEFCNWAVGQVRELVNKNSGAKKGEVATAERFVDEREIDELAQSINAIKKKKSRKSN